MSSHIALSLVTLFPLFLLAATILASSWRVRAIGEYRLALLVLILVLMAQHQALELWRFVDGVATPAMTVSEVVETGANTLASVAVYYGLGFAERQQTLAEQLERSENRYRTLVDESPLPILVHREERILFANDAAAALFGADDPSRLVGTSILDRIPPENRDRVRDRIDELLDADGSIDVAEERFLDLDGDELQVVLSGGCAPYRDDPAVHLVLQDVTREREYERSLEQTQSQLETTFESSNDAILLIDPEADEILDANGSAVDLLAYDRDELIGLSPREIHPHEVDAFEEFVNSTYDQGQLLTDGLSCKRKDDRTVPVEISASVTQWDDREVILASIRDRTERQRRRKQVEMLRRVLRHNLRNDMAVVMNEAEHIEERTDGDVARAADHIADLASNLVSVSNTIRDLQTVVEDDSTTEESVRLTPLVEGVVAEMRDRYPEATIRSSVPDGTTVTGTEALEWALENLVENAVIHNDQPEPWVEIRATKNDRRRGEWIDISVVDDGPGIPEHERGVVKPEPTETPLSHASGIDLWVVGQLADAFEGEVSIDDREDGGSVVTLHLKGTVANEATPTVPE